MLLGGRNGIVVSLSSSYCHCHHHSKHPDPSAPRGANLEQKQAASTPRGEIVCLSKVLVNARVFRKYAMLSLCLSVPRAEVYLNFLNVTEKCFTKPFPHAHGQLTFLHAISMTVVAVLCVCIHVQRDFDSINQYWSAQGLWLRSIHQRSAASPTILHDREMAF